ncbi:hypothetical protein [Microcystis phage Mvi-JY20]|uniref:Uncharacterized protein n=1 Tax=Microcystis phage Mvi-JY20 TaxID=3128146 RepID=A0AAX4QFW3_9CAUD
MDKAFNANTPVRIQITNVRESGHREGWTKQVTTVDRTKQNGYSLIGKFLSNGLHELQVGEVIVRQDPTGSVKHGGKKGSVGFVTREGEIEWTLTDVDWHTQFLLIRDEVERLLITSSVLKGVECKGYAITEAANPLEGFSTEALQTELARRAEVVK